ncbi:MAG: putative aminopeptidase [Phormidesmis priestleyi Ana]|uniref:Putative aminopeptidase n=1 Tax=Phormidesmis priestleyi Ana TaxID=1666911 RepID=A0A0P7ZVL6_9CYAN|nr:MAG: putative aminopeptidase [Phormidesmis priestleyi Ana]
MAHVRSLPQPRNSPSSKEAARQYITSRLADYGIQAERQAYGIEQERLTGVASGVNIVANIPGSDPTAGSIVLGAHYDTEIGSPGADDNGSAIATLLETARIFSTQADSQSDVLAAAADPLTAPKSIRLVFFDQEERQIDGSGLLGSLAFTQQPGNIADIKGAIILDMIGYACHDPGCQAYPPRLPIPNLPNTGDFLAVLGLTGQTDLNQTDLDQTDSDHADLLGAFAFSAQRIGPTLLTLPVPQSMLNFFPDLLRSDHAPFWDKNIPAVLVSDTANFRNPHYHTAQDKPDTLDSIFLQGSAQHVVNAIAALISQSG